jgi:hypothetical protein
MVRTSRYLHEDGRQAIALIFSVEDVFRLPSRPWPVAFGVLEGEAKVGMPIILTTVDGWEYTGEVQSIEFHSPPGKSGLTISGDAANHLAAGTIASSRS